MKKQSAVLSSFHFLSAHAVYAAWRDSEVGVVRFQGKRVYGMSRTEDGFRALVSGMTYVNFSGQTLLAVETRGITRA